MYACTQGHCLVIGARITWMELLRQAKGALKRIFGQKRQTKVLIKGRFHLRFRLKINANLLQYGVFLQSPCRGAVKDVSTPSGKSPNTGTTSLTSKDQKRKRSAHPPLLKRYTFQEMSANTYAVNNLEYDLAREAVLSP